jgi:hypothetical protein
MDTLRQGGSTLTSISVSLAEFKQKNVPQRQQKTTRDNIFKSFHGVSVLSTTYRRAAKQRCVFGFAEAAHLRAQCSNSVPRPAGTAFSTASNSPPRRSSDRVISWE